MRSQKTRLQILIDADDLVYLHKFDDSGDKSASQVIHELIYSHKTMRESIEKYKTQIIERLNQETYKEVREKQMKKDVTDIGKVRVAENIADMDKWAWLRGKQEDPDLKSSIDDDRFKPTKTRKVKK